MPRWPWSKPSPPDRPDDVLAAIDPTTRQRYREIDRAAILARLDRFAVTAVDSAWARIGERRKKQPDAGIDDPVIRALIRQSALAIVNFARHQIYDPDLRANRTRQALDLQAERWQSLAAAEPALLQFALETIAERRTALGGANGVGGADLSFDRVPSFS
jgi:hypothetical protein